MKKILVTGGTGFIGNHLVKSLENIGHDVYILEKDAGEGPKYIRRDIRDKDINIERFDYIYHLAAISSPSICENNKSEAFDINVNGTLNIINKLNKNQHLVFGSSALVYNEDDRKHNESEVLDPQNFYGLTKKMSEELIGFLSSERGYKYTILRFFNIYGSGQSKGFLIPDVIEKYKKLDQVQIVNPDAEKDFIYIDDCISGLILALKGEGVYNVCSGHGTKVKDIYSLIKTNLNSSATDELRSSSNNSPLIGNNSKIKRSLGWVQKINIKDGIKLVIQNKS